MAEQVTEADNKPIELADLTICLAILVAVGAFTWSGSGFSTRYAPSAAVALAIELQFESFSGGTLEDLRADDGSKTTLCLETKVDVDFEQLRTKFNATPILPINNVDCTLKTVEGDFGMFVAMTSFYDPNGKPALHYELIDVRCESAVLCEIDIDDFGYGETYKLARENGKWKLIEQIGRWIV
uniref:hypothetical protein n=1 Tax=uncultured Erythrobacter sp. TaxID=263913 RepID=UPI00262C3E6C|nr:hypothetical protein [uncultured Erythrobacter sp.]